MPLVIIAQRARLPESWDYEGQRWKGLQRVFAAKQEHAWPPMSFYGT